MKKVIVLFVLGIFSFLVFTFIYARTPEGRYNLLLRNVKEQIEHIAKQRDLCSKDEMKRWYKKFPKVTREACWMGIDFIYRNPNVTPEVSAQAVIDMIESKKTYWMKKLEKEYQEKH
jgi:hypothetical protein